MFANKKRQTAIFRHIKNWEMFNIDLNNFREETGDDFAILYEDANNTREVKDFSMSEELVLTWTEYEMNFWGQSKVVQVEEDMRDLDDAREWLKFWKANLRRAKRYWSMDSEKLDAIQDGEIEDEED
jgi:hypothetical protein